MVLLVVVYLLSFCTQASWGADISQLADWCYYQGVVSFNDIGVPETNELIAIGHASKIALVIKDNSENFHSYICSHNFIAKAPTSSHFISQVGIPCKHLELKEDTPLWHSEISALQYITNSSNPVFEDIFTFDSVLINLLNRHHYKSFLLMIKNSAYPPCSIQPIRGISCCNYLQKFKQKFGDKCSIQVKAEKTNKLWIMKLDSNSFVEKKLQ